MNKMIVGALSFIASTSAYAINLPGSGTSAPTPVSEPETLALIAVGAAGLILAKALKK